MDMNQVLAAELNVKPWQVEAAVKLIDEGNTIPFISRYRKEATAANLLYFHHHLHQKEWFRHHNLKRH